MSIKVDEKILEEFKNSSRHNFNIKVDEVIRPKMEASLLLICCRLYPKHPDYPQNQNINGTSKSLDHIIE